MKYLLSEAHGIGDCILILPVAKAIKKADPQAEVVVFTSSNKKKIKINEGIMSLQHYVDRIEYYSATEKLHSLGFLIKNMCKRYDYGIVVQDYDTPEASSIPSKIVKLCAKHTCGVRMTQNPAIKYDMYIEREKGVRRDEYFLRALRELGINVEKDETDLLDKELVLQNMPQTDIDRSRKTIAIVMGTAPVSRRTEDGVKTNDAKAWPYENWHQLITKFSENQMNTILMGGGKEQTELKQSSLSFNAPNVYNYVGKLSIKQSIALLGLADVVVGADTGLMHCAGAMEKPSLTLFGCTDWHEYLPFGQKSEHITANVDCSPCFGTLKSVTCEHKRCMKAITVEQVFKRTVELVT